MDRQVSIVIPCFRSGKSLPLLIQAIAQEEQLVKNGCEVILVNDGSGDETFTVIEGLTRKYPFCRGIDLAKNCGQHNAILAGMACAKGRVIVCMDDDLQTHPSQIPVLLSKLCEGYDIVYGRFVHRQHSASRNLCSRISEWSSRYLLNKPAQLRACPMFAIRRFIRDEVIRSESAYTNLLGLFLRTSGRIANVDIVHHERPFGTSGYTLRKLIRLWASYLNYSMKPLHLLLSLGAFLFAAAVIWLAVLVVSDAWGSAGLLAAWMLLLCGVLLSGMGLLGEYLGRMFMVITKEPQYVVRADTGDTNEREDIDSWRRQCADRPD